ncbi:MAG: ribonuclease HII [Candidatus Campbellbacteria bacterium]
MKTVIGIDEAGRGPLAGPVAVGCVVIRSRAVYKAFPRVRDSKKLSPQRRDEWFAKIRRLKREGALSYAVRMVSASLIDTHGIVWAISRGITSALKGVDARPGMNVLLDGGLRAPQEYTHQTTIIKGDEKELAIALASIAAKVTRDRYMVRVGKQYPRHGFGIHKGYGTKAHARAIRKFGVTPLHRKTFCRALTK